MAPITVASWAIPAANLTKAYVTRYLTCSRDLMHVQNNDTGVRNQSKQIK